MRPLSELIGCPSYIYRIFLSVVCTLDGNNTILTKNLKKNLTTKEEEEEEEEEFRHACLFHFLLGKWPEYPVQFFG